MFVKVSKVKNRYQMVRKRAEAIGASGIEVYLGCEYHRHSEMAQSLSAGVRPTMAGSRYVLVEFSSMDSYSRIRSILYELTVAGYKPIIAHAERYPVLLDSRSNVEDAIAVGGLIQLNADSVLGKNGLRVRHFCSRLLKEDAVHFIASDAHDMRERPSRLGECAAYVQKKWGEETASRIFDKNPSEIIGY